MLGKTAGGLYWMFRFLERAENTARLIEAGFRIALTRSQGSASEWRSILTTSGTQAAYDAKHDKYAAADVIDFMLRSPDNPSSVLSVTSNARDNAKLVRTALTYEVWTAVNDTWMTIQRSLEQPVPVVDLPELLGTIRRQSALVRGALHGTMLRNDIYAFARLGTFMERADNTARIIDVKYYTLLPTAASVGGTLDNAQWETILRSVSAHRAFRWLGEEEMTASSIAQFLMLDRRLPRSLAFCVGQTMENLEHLSREYDDRRDCLEMGEALMSCVSNRDIGAIFEEGLHQVTTNFIRDNNALGQQIERDYRFTR